MGVLSTYLSLRHLETWMCNISAITKRIWHVILKKEAVMLQQGQTSPWNRVTTSSYAESTRWECQGRTVCVANGEEEASFDSKSLHGDFKESMSLLSWKRIQLNFLSKENWVIPSFRLHKYHLCTAYYAHHLFSRYHNVFRAALRERNFNIR